jgi:hypothetical protein
VSITLINQILADKKSITSTEKLVLISLASFCQEGDGKAYRSFNDIASDTCLSRRCVIKTIKNLILKQIIKIIDSQNSKRLSNK